MSLRARLLAAVAYVLLLAIVAFGVPLGLSLSARVNAEVRTQAQAQADLVAATAADFLGPAGHGQLETQAGTAATSLRGRVLNVNANGRVQADRLRSSEPRQPSARKSWPRRCRSSTGGAPPARYA